MLDESTSYEFVRPTNFSDGCNFAKFAQILQTSAKVQALYEIPQCHSESDLDELNLVPIANVQKKEEDPLK
ncbi:hypothetical protein BpHYR1_039249 [Brachionus plicatilis]|uniref:Uncharacterized protein n=1 Tax=Brachionus plicatilis TaxID=10195 RepID=A0A3M7QV22_BRAPC|nr:hypothetical protein BpHYR1_039249 [Brachionus plicatilis]